MKISRSLKHNLKIIITLFLSKEGSNYKKNIFLFLIYSQKIQITVLITDNDNITIIYLLQIFTDISFLKIQSHVFNKIYKFRINENTLLGLKKNPY